MPFRRLLGYSFQRSSDDNIDLHTLLDAPSNAKAPKSFDLPVEKISDGNYPKLYTRLLSTLPTEIPLRSRTYDRLADQVDDSRNTKQSSPPVRLLRRFLKPMNGARWKGGVALFASASISVLLINLICTIWVIQKFPVEDNIGVVFRGDCARSASLTSWIHIAINLLSSILLAGSNYTMQRLSAPTREDVDKAHAKQRWLEIGVVSTTNLLATDRKKAILYTILLLSSGPLHLFYNSAVYQTIATNLYDVTIVTSDFSQGFNLQECNASVNVDYVQNVTLDYLHENSSIFIDLAPTECLKAYDTAFTTNIAEVLVVTSEPDSVNGSVSMMMSPDSDIPSVMDSYNLYICAGGLRIPLSKSFEKFPADPYVLDYTGDYADGWACIDERLECDAESCRNASKCSASSVAMGPGNWTMNGYHVQNCLARRTTEKCSVQFVIPILIVVTVSNLCKTVCMIVSLTLKERPLLTQGDAIASFLASPDIHTEDRCLWTQDMTINVQSSRSESIRNKDGNPPLQWQRRRKRWFHSASFRTWVMCILPCLVLLITGVVLLALGLQGLEGNDTSTDLKSLWSMGFGKLNPASVVALDSVLNIPAATVLANLPQLLVSMLYFRYNGLFTRMLCALEWGKLSTKRAALRVTSPQGQQRSTYFLQLPYRYSIPLWLISVLLHWLLSQSLFLASVEFIYHDEPIANNVNINQAIVSSSHLMSGYTTLGYSSIAIIFTLALGAVVVLAVIAMAFRAYPERMPFVGNCSFAISAACHPPSEDTNAALKPVTWGCPVEGTRDVVEDGEDHLDKEQVRHCCITSLAVMPPIPGKYYA